MSTSPAQRLFSRRTRTRLPTSTRLLEPATGMTKTKVELEQAKSKQALYYNRGVKSLPELKVGDIVRMLPKKGKKMWAKAKVTMEVSPRS